MLLGQSPFINQGELDKSILELDEPGMVARLYQDPNEKQKDQAERQMLELTVMEHGFPQGINDDDDDLIHAKLIIQFMTRNAQIQKQPQDPAGPIMIMQHFQAHMQRGMQKDSKTFGELQRQFQQTIAQIQEGQGGPNGQGGQPGQPPMQGPPPGPPPMQQGPPMRGMGPPPMQQGPPLAAPEELPAE